MQTITITDKEVILETMRGYALAPKKQKASLMVEIRVVAGASWNGKKIGPGGLIIEGPRPISVVRHCDTGDTVFNISNSDSDYTRTIGQVRLADIKSITVFR